ncbi:MAG: dienelactone hydrolase family protein [Anaerolineae bacterium]|nr:dienelactone hydrolase family protein [Gemmatimonadaceae bacterium]
MRELQILLDSDDAASRFSALLQEPANPHTLAVLAHGAGAGMRHPFMQSIADSLAAQGIATLRFNFPYMESRRARPDPPAVAELAVRAAVAAAKNELPSLPVIAGGKSFGGRMTSSAAANCPLDHVQALFFLGYPLHPPNRPDVKRAEHLARIRVPMLFLQGTRDALADLTLLEPVIRKLGERATLHTVEDADHSFSVLKRSGRTDAEVMEGLASTIASWAALLQREP